MDVGKSVRIALVRQEKTQKWLADQLNLSKQRVGALAHSRVASQATIERLADTFGMRVSDFIALGETDKRDAAG